MDQEHCLAFGPFRLETTQGRLWCGEQVIPLRPRSLALLCYLVAHPGRLVTKAEVRQHVWAGTHVTDTVLRVSVHEIRAALGDAAAPRYVETVGRQGYRFLGGGDPDAPHRLVFCRSLFSPTVSVRASLRCCPRAVNEHDRVCGLLLLAAAARWRRSQGRDLGAVASGCM
jgi:hypothetical protein